MRFTARWLALATGMVLLDMIAGGCSYGSEPGTPVPASSPVSSSAAAPASSSTRPAVLPLDGVAPCGLVTEAMRRQFKIDRPDGPNNTDPNMPRCVFVTTTVGQYLVAVVRNQGIEALGRQVTTTVAGFPAVEIQRPNIKIGHLSVDVADGQRLDIEVQRLSSSQPVEEIYRDTRTFAEAVVATLRQKLGR